MAIRNYDAWLKGMIESILKDHPDGLTTCMLKVKIEAAAKELSESDWTNLDIIIKDMYLVAAIRGLVRNNWVRGERGVGEGHPTFYRITRKNQNITPKWRVTV